MKQDRKRAPIHLPDGGETVEYERFVGILVEGLANPVIEVRLINHTVMKGNHAAFRRFGYRKNRLEGMRIDDLLSDSGSLDALFNSGGHIVSGVYFVNAFGESFSASLQCIYLRKFHEDFVLIILHDIADQEKEARDLEMLQRLGLEVLRTRGAFFYGQEFERQRLSHELHSNIGPSMTTVKIGLERLLSMNEKEDLHQELESLREMQAGIIKQVRLVSSRLAEGFKYQENINLAIDSLIKSYSEFGDIRFSVSCDSLPENMPLKVSYHLFQLLEEAFTNIVKHSGAEKATFRIRLKGSVAEVVLQDDGRGVDKPMVRPGSGLWMMEQRAHLIGGKIVLKSVKGQYFRVELIFPTDQSGG